MCEHGGGLQRKTFRQLRVSKSSELFRCKYPKYEAAKLQSVQAILPFATGFKRGRRKEKTVIRKVKSS